MSEKAPRRSCCSRLCCCLRRRRRAAPAGHPEADAGEPKVPPGVGVGLDDTYACQTSTESTTVNPVRSQEASSDRDGEWYVGGRYQLDEAVQAFATPELAIPFAVLPAGTEVTVMLLEGAPGSLSAFVVSPVAHGWVSLESGAVQQQRRFGSWELGGRYRVRHPVTLRLGPSLESDEVLELPRGQEVLAIELALNRAMEPCVPDDGVRLRLCVSTSSGAVGWMSPETAKGKLLLDPLNLHSDSAVDRLRSLPAGANFAERSSQVQRTKSGRALPWLPGGKYRILEAQRIYEHPNATPRHELGRVGAGSCVLVAELKSVELDGSWYPWALVETEDSEKLFGWIRCRAAEDDRDLIDTRNHLEIDVVMKRLSIRQTHNLPLTGLLPDGGGARGGVDAKEVDGSLETSLVSGAWTLGEAASSTGNSSVTRPPGSPLKAPPDSRALNGRGGPPVPRLPRLSEVLGALEEGANETRRVEADVPEEAARCDGCFCDSGRKSRG